MRTLFIALGVMTAAVSSAQLSTINSTQAVPRFWNDIPTSNLTFTNVWPGVVIDDQNVSRKEGGYANRNAWFLSNDGGVNPYLFNTSFTYGFKVKLDVVGGENKEAGVMLLNDLNFDHIFLIKTANNGEVEAFAGGFPFYSCTSQWGDQYVPGTTVDMSITYFLDPVDNVNKVIYRFNNHFSGALPWANNEGFMGPDTKVGGYLQVVNDPNNPNNAGKAAFSDIYVCDANKALTSAVVVKLGKNTAGNNRSLFKTDGDMYRMCKFVVPNQNAHPVNIEVEGTCNYSSLSALAFHVNSRMANSGQFGQTLDLYDWSTSSFSATDTRTDPINTTLTIRDLAATGALSRYLSPDQVLKARIRVKATGVVATQLWCMEVDEANFTVTP